MRVLSCALACLFAAPVVLGQEYTDQQKRSFLIAGDEQILAKGELIELYRKRVERMDRRERKSMGIPTDAYRQLDIAKDLADCYADAVFEYRRKYKSTYKESDPFSRKVDPRVKPFKDARKGDVTLIQGGYWWKWNQKTGELSWHIVHGDTRTRISIELLRDRDPVSNDWVEEDMYAECLGTYTYTTAIGGTNTIRRYREILKSEWLKLTGKSATEPKAELPPFSMDDVDYSRMVRKWTSLDGKFTCQARLVGYQSSPAAAKLIIDGELRVVPYGSLSLSDRNYIRSFKEALKIVADASPWCERLEASESDFLPGGYGGAGYGGGGYGGGR